MLSAAELRLMAALHGDFPLVDRPYAAVGEKLGMSESEVLQMLATLLQRGDLTRFGPLFQIERAGGLFVLAALAVPEDRFAQVTALVNAQMEVAHNYRREHHLNMWFVIAAETPERAYEVIARIETLTDLPVHAFPKEREYFVELRLPLVADAPAEKVDHGMD